MIFFGLIIVVTLATAVLSRLNVSGLSDWRTCMRWGLALALVATGLDHLANPGRYLPMMPDFVPLHSQVIFFTGLCELAGAFGLLVVKLRWWAAVMLSIYFVCVFPANVKNAVEGLAVEGLPSATWYYWIRLLFQPIVIWWSLYVGGVTNWPIEQQSPTISRP